MILPTLLDAGPFVSFLDHRDARHAWATARFGEVRGPFLTCEAVIVETCFILRRYPTAVRAAVGQLVSGRIVIDFDLNDEAQAVAALMDRYASVPMSLADACLVRMAELNDRSPILTLDHDFLIYRNNGREPLDAVLPEDRA